MCFTTDYTLNIICALAYVMKPLSDKLQKNNTRVNVYYFLLQSIKGKREYY